eukprot:CAMPEP_0196724350 /NCGR_PEP_ID=MMETSP1091-20130531/6238_1 /TAXON_ID=302021 /ORGANISM="Rhodomonas sp., Strain CCMP768" /LENGTH=216 /DNA_ID=CAMNT_0042066459 /DNA_START=55 /DNA_END=702 /DNA_ORIENTATION=+
MAASKTRNAFCGDTRSPRAVCAVVGPARVRLVRSRVGSAPVPTKAMLRVRVEGGWRRERVALLQRQKRNPRNKCTPPLVSTSSQDDLTALCLALNVDASATLRSSLLTDSTRVVAVCPWVRIRHGFLLVLCSAWERVRTLVHVVTIDRRAEPHPKWSLLLELRSPEELLSVGRFTHQQGSPMPCVAERTLDHKKNAATNPRPAAKGANGIVLAMLS